MSMLVKLLEIIFEAIFTLTSDYGLTIIVYSVILSIITNYFKSKTKRFVFQEEVFQKILDPKKRNINLSVNSRKDKHLRIRELYEKYSYNPLFRFRLLIPILIQIPFLVGTYVLFKNIKFGKESSILGIRNLDLQDGLLYGFNLLPFIILLINLVLMFSIKNQNRKQKVSSFIISSLFLILIYNEKSALLIFWCLSNIMLIIIPVIKKNSVLNFNFLLKNQNLKLIRILLIIFLFVIPINIFSLFENTNVGDIAFAISSNYMIYIILSIFFAIIIFVLDKLFKNNILNKIINSLVLFLIVWVTFSGLLFPIIEKTGGLTKISQTPLNLNNLLIVSIITIICTVTYQFEKYKVYLKIAFLILITGTLLTSLNKIKIQKTVKGRDELEILKFSKEKNLIVLSFDGLPGNIANDILIKDKEMFKDFTLFENTLSSAPTTFSSLTFELFGNINLKDISKNKEGLLKNLPLEGHLINSKNSSDLSVSTFGDYKIFRTNLSNHYDNILTDYEIGPRISKWLFLFEIKLARILSGKSSIYLDKIIWVLSNNISKLNLFSNPILNHKGPSWDKEMINHKNDFENLISHSFVSNEKLIIKYMHFAFTHFPVDFDEKGNYKSDDKQWFENNQNYQGLYSQTIFSIKEFEKFIVKLKELNVYDNSIIVLKSDHGEPPNYFNKFPHNLKINGHETFGYNRYKPVLLIKNFKEKNNSMKIESKVVTLGDLSYTIDKVINLGNCTSINNFDLITKDNYNLNSDIFLLIPEDENSNSGYDSYKSVQVKRNGVLIDQLKEKLVKLDSL
jgi:membrane protein insertase Oxa1/YidC/SpoIIIJ